MLDAELEYVDSAKLRYTLVCGVCKRVTKVTASQLHLFDKHIGYVQLNIAKSEFHSLFDSDDKAR